MSNKQLSVMDCTRGFAVPGETLIDTIHPGTGLSWCFGETLDQIRRRYPGAVEVDIAEFCADKGRRQDTKITWAECTEEKYMEMLEVLPPAAMGNGGFLVGEPMDHHAGNGQPRFSGFIQRGGKCFAASRPMTRKEFAAECLAFNNSETIQTN